MTAPGPPPAPPPDGGPPAAPPPGRGLPAAPPPDSGPPASVAEAIHALRHQLGHLEAMIGPEIKGEIDAARGGERRAVHREEERPSPAWQRSHQGEARFPVALILLLAVALELVLPADLALQPTWILPGLEIALIVGTTAANPRRVDRRSIVLRYASLTLIALISLANAISSAELIRGLINGGDDQAGPLLANGGSIYLTNIIVFALWYWEWDRGGPVARTEARQPYPDLLFPQMTQIHLAPDDWVPTFLDYLYVSFTNATAFSPTDTMPLSRWAKLLMGLQAAVSLVVVALVIARAVNILR